MGAARAFGVLLLIAIGCAAPRFAPVELGAPGWTLRQGQAVWRSSRNAREIAGDLMAAWRDGEGWLQFSKTPFELVSARMSADGWRIDFPAQDRSYAGRGRPPSQIGWFQVLRRLDNSGVAGGRAAGSRWVFEGDSKRWRIEDSTTGESIEGYFEP